MSRAAEGTMLWKPQRVAAELGISVKTLMEHVKAGEIVYVPRGRGQVRPRIAFKPSDVEAFIEHRRRRDACQSISTKTARIINLTSNSAASGFMAQRSKRIAEMRNKGK